MQISLQSKQKQLPKLAVDIMGADFGPQQIVAGVRLALERNTHRIGKLLLVGDESILNPIVRTEGLNKESLVEIVHASQVITMDEKPLQTLILHIPYYGIPFFQVLIYQVLHDYF